MTTYEYTAYVNLVLSFIGASLYIRYALLDKSGYMMVHKLMTAFNLIVMALVYFLYIAGESVNPIVVRLNTTLIIILVISNAIIGRLRHER